MAAPRASHLWAIRQFAGLNARWAQLHVSSKDEALCLHDDLSMKKHTPKYEEELSLYYLLEKPAFLTSGPSDVFSTAPDAGSTIAGTVSLRGQLFKFGGTSGSPVTATTGDIVKNKGDGRLWVVTAKHVPRQSGPPPQLKADSDINPDNYDVSGIKPLCFIEPKERPTKASTVTAILFEFVEEITTDLECRLIPVNAPDLMFPNKFRLEPSDPYENLGTYIEPDPRAGKAAVLAGASGCHFMRMLASDSLLASGRPCGCLSPIRRTVW